MVLIVTILLHHGFCPCGFPFYYSLKYCLMKNVLYIFAISFFLNVNPSAKAQENTELSFGLGVNYALDKADHFVHEAGAEVGFYLPVFNKSLFSLGVEWNGGYYFSSTRPALTPIIPITGVEESYNTFESVHKPVQKNGFISMGPRFSFYPGTKLQLALSLNAGLAYVEKSAYSYIQHIPEGAISPGSDSFDKVIYEYPGLSKWLLRLSPKLRLAYPFNDRISVWGAGSYNTIGYTRETKEVPTTPAGGKPYDWEAFMNEPASPSIQRKAMRSTSLQMGIAIRLVKKKDKKKPPLGLGYGYFDEDFKKAFPPYTYPKFTELAEGKVININNGSLNDTIPKTRAIGFNSSRSNRPMQLKADDAGKKTMSPALWIDANGTDTYTTINQNGKLYVMGFNSSRSNRPMSIIILPEEGYSMDSLINRNEVAIAIGFNSSRSNRPMQLKGDEVEPTVVVAVSEHRKINYLKPGSAQSGERVAIEIPGSTLDAIGFNSSRSNRPMQLNQNGDPSSVIRVFDIKKFSSASSCGTLSVHGWSGRSEGDKPTISIHMNNLGEAITLLEDNILYIININQNPAISGSEKITLIDVGEVKDIESKIE